MAESTPVDVKDVATWRARVPVMIAIFVVIAVAGGYALVVRDKRDYFVNRNLRILSTLATEIDDTFTAQQNFVGNYAESSKWAPKERDKLLPYSSGPCDDRTPGLTLKERWLNVVNIPRKPGQIECRQIALGDVLEPLLNREQFGVFDAVFLANANGHVLYSIAPPRESSTLLWQSAPGRQELRADAVIASRFILTDLRPIQEVGSLLGRNAVNINLANLRTSSQHLSVEISGDSYILFTHPYAFNTPKRVPASADKNATFENQWIVGAFVSKARFDSDVRAVSASKLALAIAICVLAICAWPFLRISLMTDRQPLTITDVALLAICSIVAVSLVTMTLLDIRAYQQLGYQGDEQLQSFAYKLEHDLNHDVIAALKALDVLDWNTPSWGREQPESGLLRRAVNGESDVYTDLDVAAHPYFSDFSRIGADGKQTYKLSTGPLLPLIDVSERRYFQEARDQHTWDARPSRDGSERYPYSLQWVQSLTTGETRAVVAKNSGRKDDPVVALTTSLINVENAIPPPGTSFAIIDEQGEVIYHPDNHRIGRENFFAEADFNRELRAAVISRADDFVSSPYWGEDQRIFVHPLANTQWTVVVFRAKRLLRAMNIEALLLTIIGLLANALPYLLAELAVMVIAPAYRAPSLWPDPERADDYSRLAVIFALAALAYLLAIYALDPGDIMPVAALFPLQAILSAYVLLHRDLKRRVLRVVMTGVWMAVTATLLLMLFFSSIEKELQVSAKPARMRWLLIAFVVFESVVALKQMTASGAGAVSSEAPSREPAPADSLVLQSAGSQIKRTAPSTEALVAWAVISIVAVVVTWKRVEGMWGMAATLMVVLAAVAVLHVLFTGPKAAARRTNMRDTIVYALSELPSKIALHLSLAGAALLFAYAVARHEFYQILVPTILYAAIGAWWIGMPREPTPTPRERTRLRVVRLIWSAVALTLLIIVGNRTSWLPPQDSWGEWAVPTAFFIALVVTVALADGVALVEWSTQFREQFRPLPYPFSYRIAGVLTLLVLAVLPTVAYFKVGSRVEQESLVKYAQLRMASALESRINRIASLICDNAAADRPCLGGLAASQASSDAFSFRLPSAWDTLCSIAASPPARHDLSDVNGDHAMLARLIPQYSDDSVALRQLYGKASSDPLWNWTTDGRLLTLERLVRFEPLAAQALENGAPPHQQSLHLSSRIPLLFPTVLSVPNLRRFVSQPLALAPSMPESVVNSISVTIYAIVAVAFCLALLWWIVDFVTDRVLLLDVQAPLWIDVDQGVAVGENVFLVRGKVPLKTVLAKRSEVLLDLEFAKMDSTPGAWDSSLREIDLSSARNICIVDFEYNIDDPKTNLRKLTWLERVMSRDRSVLIVSALTPAYVLGLGNSRKLTERWKTLLGSFLCVTWDDVVLRRAEHEKSSTRSAPIDEWTIKALLEALRKWQASVGDRRKAVERWLEMETSNSAVLRRLSAQLQELAPEQVRDELLERAATYYRALWSVCSEEEKLLLFHLARHGFVQSKKRWTLRRVMARGLVRRAPHLQLMSESFRAYVCAAGVRERLPELMRKIEAEGPWRTLRVPIFVVITSFLLLLFATQKDLLTATTGLATAMTTGLPVLVNLFGMLTRRRLETGLRAG